MAKTVTPVAVELKIKGGEKLGLLDRAFRDLAKQIKLTDTQLEDAIKGVFDFAKEAGNSEATIRAQIKAFEGLREQAVIGGRAYRELADEISNLKAQVNGSTPAIEAKRKSILEFASGAELTAKQLKSVIVELSSLRSETKLDSVAFNALGKDIDGLTGRISALAEQTKRTASENRAAVAAVNATLAKYEAAAQGQAASAARREQIVRDEVLALSEKKKVTDELTKKENQLTAAIARRRQLSVQESAREARRRVRAGANVYTGRGELGPIDALDERLGGLPQTTAAFSQRLSELQDRLVNTARGGDQYVQVALRIAQVQREASAATQGLGAALVKDLETGVAAKNQKNLREAIGQLQAEMSELNLETQEGTQRYAENARQVNALEQQLNKIASSYRTVADVARQAGMAVGVGVNPFTATGAMRGPRPDSLGRARLANAILQGAAEQATTLFLPAAGETTAAGTGGARRLGIAREVVRGAPTVDVTAPALGLGEQVIRKQVSALREAASALGPYNDAIRKARVANNNSISSINNLKNALIAKRNELPTTSAAFRRLTREIEMLDAKSERASRRMSRRRMSPGQFAQATGATLSGGIFGGPEGFLGGLGGAILGGPGGAFAGAAAGAQVGQLRRALGDTAAYSAQIGKLKIALEGISKGTEEYNRALAAAASVNKELNVSQEVSIRGITRLVAAVQGAGGGVADAELAFKSINSAIIATGGNAEQVEGAITALVQIFSKGKVSAEEINQIAERLPGTFNKIAEASGRTGPELTKALQQGEVGLNDLMKFLKQLKVDYEDLAKDIAESSESAGARLEVAFEKMRIEVGKALQPIGAEFQDAFTEFIRDITPDLVKAARSVADGLKFIFDNREAIGTVASFALKMAGVNLALKAFAALNGPVKIMFAMLQAEMGKTSAMAVVAKGKLAGLLGTVKALSVIGAITITVDVLVTGIREVERAKKLIEELRGKVLTPGSVSEEFGGSIPAETKEKAKQVLAGVKDELKTARERYAVLQATGRVTLAGIQLSKRIQLLKLRQIELQQKIALPTREEKPEPEVTDFPDPVNEDSGGSKEAKAKAVRKSQLESIRNAELLLGTELQLLDNARAIGRAQFDNNRARINQLNNQRISLEFAKQAAEVEFRYIDAVAAAAGDENEAAIVQEAALKREIEDRLLLIQYEGQLADEAQRRALEQKAAAKAAEDEVFSLREKLGLVTAEERISRFRQRLTEEGSPRVDELTDLYRQTIDPTFSEGIAQNIRTLKEELTKLIDPINQVTNAANAIGTAFADSFTSAIDGSATAQEALAGFFSNLSRYFLEAAGQIIQKMITIAILNQVARVLPGSGGSGFSFSGGSADAGLSAANLLGGIGSLVGFANGGAFDKGVVRKPMMFAYANGGVDRFGLMGESGPEAIMPLRRDSSGRLGVDASGGSSNNIVVNVDASGTQVQGDNTRAKELGSAISAAVQAELIKQRRPGGLLVS